MKAQSAKAKGRRFQQEVASLIQDVFDLPEEDVVSRSMGASGTDIMLSHNAISKFPFAVECKNVERLNIWQAFNQAEENSSDRLAPLLVIARNRSRPLAVMDLQEFLLLVEKAYSEE